MVWVDCIQACEAAMDLTIAVTGNYVREKTYIFDALYN